MKPAAVEPRIVKIGDGLHAEVIERTILPKRLDALLGELRDVRSRPARLLGTRRDCRDGEHDLQLWRSAIWRARELRLALCAFCGAIEVRDVSFDILPGFMSGRTSPRRKSDVLGWYSGRRPLGREYR